MNREILSTIIVLGLTATVTAAPQALALEQQTEAAPAPAAATPPQPVPAPAVAVTTVPPTPSAAAAVPDASFRAMKDQVVVLGLESGQGLREITGRLIAFEDQTVTLVVVPTNEVVTFFKKSILSLRAVDLAPAKEPIEATENAGAVRERHFAINLGIPPEIAVDLDYGYFYGFGDVSIVFPAATDGNWLPMSIGAGVNFRPVADSAWKMEIFAHYSPTRWSSDHWCHAFGVGLGVHYTTVGGLTFGFKVPIFGYSVSPSESHYDSGSAVAMYYLAGAVGLPVASIGYRF